jgi:hypothetical protein
MAIDLEGFAITNIAKTEPMSDQTNLFVYWQD